MSPKKIKSRTLSANIKVQTLKLTLMDLLNVLNSKLLLMMKKFTSDALKKIRELRKEFTCVKIIDFKVYGLITIKLKVMRSLLSDITTESLLTVFEMGKENLYGRMVRGMKENGSWEQNMALGYGNREEETAISGNGIMERWRDMAFISVRMGKGTKEISKTFLKMEKANKHFQMEMYLRGNIALGNLLVLENTHGKI